MTDTRKQPKGKILIIINRYLPGYKSGGPIKTIANMIEAIGDYYNFYIVTSDRDRDETKPYPEIKYNAWNSVGKARVWYLPYSRNILQSYIAFFQSNHFDLIYIQSFFNFSFTIVPLIVLSCLRIKMVPILIAPRGEFGSGALHFKKMKKSIYIFLFNLFFSKMLPIEYHCSTDEEKKDIQSRLGSYTKCHVAFNFPTQEHIHSPLTCSDNGILRIVFLARLDPKKNLDFAIRLLTSLTGCRIVFDIYGVITHKKYFSHCLSIASMVQQDVTIKYCGEMLPADTINVLSQYDLFFFPTQNENYGHVIHEALLSGLPVLCSDQTPWHELKSRGAGWEIPLNRSDLFKEAILDYFNLPKPEKIKMKYNALQYGIDVSSDTMTISKNTSMFDSILKTNFNSPYSL